MGSLDPDVDMKQELDDSGYVQDETGSKATMEEYRGSANLLDLSDDVLLYILKNLSANDLKALGFTCSRLGALVVDHTLWVDVDGRDVPHGAKRVRWLLMRVLGPHTRSLRLKGYADHSTGCLGFVTRHEREDSDEEAPAEEERYLCEGSRLYRVAQPSSRCDNRYPFWMNAIPGALLPSQPTGRPTEYAVRPAPAQPVAGPSQVPTSSSRQSVQPSVSTLEPATGPSTQPSETPAEPGPSQQNGSQPRPTSAMTLPSRGGSSAVLAAGSQSWQVTSFSQLSTSEPVPLITEPGPFTSEPVPSSSKSVPSTSEPVASTSESVPSTSESVPSTSEPVPSTSEPVPSTTEPVPSTSESVPSTSESVPSTSESVPSTSESVPSTSEPVPSTSASVPSTSESVPSTSEPVPSTSESTRASSSQSYAEPSTSASESQPSASGSQIPSAAAPQASASRPQIPEVPAAAPSPPQPAEPSQASRNQRRMFMPLPRAYSTSNTSCHGPQLTFTHTGLRALSILCPNLTVLELDNCVIDCQTTSIGQFPKTLLRLSLRGTKCFNMEAKTFLFKIQDHLAILEDIDVSYCSWIEPACMLPLSKMPNLLRLSMRECLKLTEFVAYASLATRYGFKKLKVLDLGGSPVGDSEVSALGWLPALEELYLSPSPKTPPVEEHAHYRTDTLPMFNELADWEETDPDYFKISEAQEDEWTRDEESAQGIRNRFYNCEDPSACILLERMIAEPVSPSECSGVYHQFLAAHNANAHVPIANPEQHRAPYRNYMERPNRPQLPVGYSLVIRRPTQFEPRLGIRGRRVSAELPDVQAQAQQMRTRRSPDQPAGPGQEAAPKIRRRRSSDQQPVVPGQEAAPKIRRRRSSDQQPVVPGQEAAPKIRRRRSSDQQPVGHGQNDTPKIQRSRSSDQRSVGQEEQGAALKIRSRRSSDQQSVGQRDATQQMPRRRSLDHPGPSSDADKPGTSGQKRKSDKNNDSSSDDDNSPTKVAATTRTIATQTGIGGCSKNNSKGSKQTKKTRRPYTHRSLIEFTFDTTLEIPQHPRWFSEAAGNNNNDNNNRQDNNQGPAGPNVGQPMEVDQRPTNDNRNPINDDAVAGPSNRAQNPTEYDQISRSVRRLLRVAHRAALSRAALARIGATQDASAQVEAENIAAAEIPRPENTENETEKATDETEKATDETDEKNKKTMDVDVNPVNDGANSVNADRAGPSNDEQLNNYCLYTRNIVLYRRRNPAFRREAGNQAGSAHVNGNGGNNHATENETEEASNETEKATNETENDTNETEGKNTKDAGNQTMNLYNGVPGIDDVPLTPQQEERNRILYENRAHNILVDQSPHLSNMDQNLNCSFKNASRAVLDAFAYTENRPRPADRHRLLQFRQYRRPIAIEEVINSVCNEPRNQRPMPRGLFFSGLIPPRLDHSSLISDSSIRRFGRATGENIVYIGGGPIPARSMARPDRSNLRILSVTGFRHVTDSSLVHLASAAPQLQTLDLRGTGVTVRGAQAFRTLRPDVKLITDHPEDNLGLD